MKKDNFTQMTTAPIPGLIGKLAVPTIISMLVTSFYNIADTYFVGKINTQSTAAVGIVFSVMSIIQAVGFFFGHGSGNYISRKLGAQETDNAEKMAATGFFFALFMGVVIAVVGLLLLTPLSVALGSTPTILPYTEKYLGIILIGAPFMTASLVLNNQLRFQGSAAYAMVGITSGAVLNIGLDPLLIFVFDMGVAGAAIATVLSQAVSAVWILRFLTGRKTILRLKARNMLLQGKIILPCLALGISSFVMVSTESVLSVSFTSSLSRYGGDVAVGAMTVLTSVNQLITMPLQGICQGGQPLISYNYGAKKLERVKEAFFCQFLVCVGYTTVFWLLVLFLPRVFAGIFTSDGALVDYTAWAIRIFLAGTFSVGFQVSCQLAFMALGQAKISLIMACLRKLILLIPLIFILPNFFADKAFAVFLAEPVSDILAAAVTTITFFTFFRKLLKAGKQ